MSADIDPDMDPDMGPDIAAIASEGDVLADVPPGRGRSPAWWPTSACCSTPSTT
jgi:hypothetical protein